MINHFNGTDKPLKKYPLLNPLSSQSMYDYHRTNSALIKSLKVTDMLRTRQVQEAFENVDRKFYCPIMPYADIPQDIGYNATISAPHMHAYCLEQLKDTILKPKSKVLDVGSGSGFLVACIAFMMIKNGQGGRVYGIEHIPELVQKSISNMKQSNQALLNTTAFFLDGDGFQGLDCESPFDCIHVGAASLEPPRMLIDQLVPGGKMIIPLGNKDEQWLTLIEKDMNKGLSYQKLIPVRYVPLVDKAQKI